MSRVLRVCGKDLRTLWVSPVVYGLGAAFNAVLAILYLSQLQARHQALIQPMFPLAGFLLLLALPTLTMRAFAEEARSGTLDVLAAVPVPPRVLVVGKWLAVWLTTLVVLLPTLAFVALLRAYGRPESGPIIAGFVGLILLAGLLAALGVLASAITTSQSVAALVALFAALVLWFAHVGSDALATANVVAHVSISERLRAFAGGGIDTGDLTFFLAATAVALVAAASALRARRRTGGWRAVIGAAVLVVVFVTIGVLADRTHRLYDLTDTNSLTLTTQTRDVVRGVSKRVALTAFIGRDEPGRSEAAALLQRYRRLNPHISFRVADPGDTPSLLRQLGVDPSVDVIAAQLGDHVARAPTVTEADVTSVLAQVTRPASSTLCFTSGHGEADLTSEDGAGLAAAARLLASNGYEARAVDLLVGATIPASCHALFISAPTAEFDQAATDSIVAYLAAGGRAVVLADPASTVDLSPLLAPYRLRIDRGIVVDPAADAHLPDDPTTLIVSSYAAKHPVVRRLAPTEYPAAESIVTGSLTKAEGLSVVALVVAGDRSYLDRRPDGRGFEPSEDGIGPIVIGAAADLSHVAGPTTIVRSRVAVFGDADFATNAFIADGGNARLLVQALDWATTAEDLVPLNANIPPFRPLALTNGRLGAARLRSIGLIPALFPVAGALLWWRRRRR